MAQDNFYPYFQPPNNFFGRLSVAFAILGSGRGKFKNQSQNYLPFTKGPILIDTSPGSLMTVAMSVPHLNTVLSTGAEYFSLMNIRHVDKDENDVENSKVLEFLKNPNCLQTREQFLYELYILNGVYNKTFQHKVIGLSFEKIPKALWLLPSGWMKINVTGKIYKQTELEGIIESFEMLAYNSSEIYEVEKTIYMPEGIGNNVLNPVSRIDALQIPLSNIVASLKSFNLIVSERGMIGFFSPDGAAKDSDGVLPYSAPEAKRFREEYQNQFNLDASGGHVSMTTNNTRWNPMSFPVKDLMLLEGIEDAFAAVCAAYRHDRDIYPSVKGATFENKAAGMRLTIQNAIQPLADKLMGQWTKHFIENPDEKLIACYDHLPCMKEDERLAAQGQLYRAQATDILLRNGTISHDQNATLNDVEQDGTKELSQPNQNGNQPNTNQPAAN